MRRASWTEASTWHLERQSRVSAVLDSYLKRGPVRTPFGNGKGFVRSVRFAGNSGRACDELQENLSSGARLKAHPFVFLYSKATSQSMLEWQRLPTTI